MARWGTRRGVSAGELIKPRGAWFGIYNRTKLANNQIMLQRIDHAPCASIQAAVRRSISWNNESMSAAINGGAYPNRAIFTLEGKTHAFILRTFHKW